MTREYICPQIYSIDTTFYCNIMLVMSPWNPLAKKTDYINTCREDEKDEDTWLKEQ